MRKSKLRFGLTLFIIFVGLLFGVLISNQNSLRYKNQYDQNFPTDHIEFKNWAMQDQGMISEQDPNLVITLPGVQFVESLAFDGSLTPMDLEVEVFYTETSLEEFSQEKSFKTKVKPTAQGFLIVIEKNAQKIRIDLGESAGSLLVVNKTTLNPTRILFNAKAIFFSAMTALIFSLLLYMPKHALKNLPIYFHSLEKYKFLVFNLVKRDLTTKYRRSVLGILWSVLNPLMMMIVITAVFQQLFRVEVENFPIYYLTGTLIFNFVSEATNASLTSIVGSAALIKKVYIPKYIFPLEKCLFAFVNMLFSLIAVVIMMVVLRVPPQWTLILIPLPLIYTLVFCIGFGMILASMNVFFRDISHLYGVWVTVWLYLTPIIYPVSILPEPVLAIVKLNPLYYYVDYFRQLVLYGTVPNLSTNLTCIFFSITFLILGLFMFKKTQDRFILYI